jgi:hypothetical protein
VTCLGLDLHELRLFVIKTKGAGTRLCFVFIISRILERDLMLVCTQANSHAPSTAKPQLKSFLRHIFVFQNDP